MNNTYQSVEEIIFLIQMQLMGQLNEEQQSKLDCWLEESPGNRQLFEQIKSSKDLSKRLALREQINLDEEWQALQRKMRRSKQRFISPFIKYAAAVVLILSVAVALLVRDYRQSDSPAVELLENLHFNQKAILTLASGERVELGSERKKEIVLQDGVSLQDSVGELVYCPIDAPAKDRPLRYNTISIPRGGEYRLRLEDGTVVYLNSESELRFPEHFAANCRQIELKGEAYLKVSKDANRPFIVQTSHADIEVLGTAFNVSSYDSEAYSTATLVEGSIKVSSGDEATIIVPGQQARVDSEERISVQEVDVEKVISWTRGVFEFENDCVEDVFKTLARWYDVDFSYADEHTKDYRLTGRFRRSSDVNEVLSTIQKTNVIAFKIQDRKIEVRDLKQE
ncbi:MAG: FecR family protein [Mangrovibacterium sp.]